MRCSFGYLVCWGSLAVAARGIVEGPKREVILLGGRSNFERSGLFSSRNPLSRCNMQLGIKLSQDLVAGATYTGVGPIICSSKSRIIFRNKGWFKKNQHVASFGFQESTNVQE